MLVLECPSDDKKNEEILIPFIKDYVLQVSDKEDIIDMKIKDFKLPITLTQDHVTSLLKVDNSGNPPEHMYV